MKDDIILPYSPKVKKTKFRGSSEYNLKVMKKLQKKFPQYCFIIPEVKKKNFDHEDVSLRWIQIKGKYGKFNIPGNDKYWTLFNRCINKRFILIPFGFTCLKYGGHANYLIYDRNEKSLERFEPYGKSSRDCTNPYDLDDKIKKLFQDNLGVDFIKKYYKPLDFMPIKSFQSLQEDEGEMSENDNEQGYCAAIVAYFTELRLNNPNKDRKRLVKIALEKLKNGDKSLTEIFRGYSTTLIS